MIRFLLCLILLAAPAAAGARTAGDQSIGRTACYDDNGFMIACPVDLNGEEMDRDIPSRFIDNGDDTVSDQLLGMAWFKDEKNSIRAWAAKVEPRFIARDDNTMVDIDTGLIWLRDANCIASTYPGFDRVEREEDGRVSWRQARVFIARLNDSGYFRCNAGYTDWRLPSLDELLSLVADSVGPVKESLLQQGFANVAPVYYWSSTQNLLNIYFAWAVSLQNGRVANLPKSMGLNVWPVREESGKR